MSTALSPIIDFHSHHVPARWRPTTLANFPPSQRSRWERINRRLADPAALLESIESADITARVVNIPTALFAEAGQTFAADLFEQVNDEMALLVTGQPGKLHGLASVDAFAGEASARELTRAVRQLGLRGVFVESEKGGLLLDAPEARPTLATAAELGVPVFAHPVNMPVWTDRMARFGQAGTLLARGTVNAASLVALLEGGVFEALPTLRVVVTNLALGGVLLARAFGSRADGRDVAALLRRHVWVDTMGFEPAVLRTAADLLGVENLLAGSDWPIVSDGPIRERLDAALAEAGFSPVDQERIRSGNAQALLGL